MNTTPATHTINKVLLVAFLTSTIMMLSACGVKNSGDLMYDTDDAGGDASQQELGEGGSGDLGSSIGSLDQEDQETQAELPIIPSDLTGATSGEIIDVLGGRVDSSQWSTYTSEEHGFSLTYPDECTISESIEGSDMIDCLASDDVESAPLIDEQLLDETSDDGELEGEASGDDLAQTVQEQTGASYYGSMTLEILAGTSLEDVKQIMTDECRALGMGEPQLTTGKAGDFDTVTGGCAILGEPTVTNINISQDVRVQLIGDIGFYPGGATLDAIGMNLNKNINQDIYNSITKN